MTGCVRVASVAKNHRAAQKVGLFRFARNDRRCCGSGRTVMKVIGLAGWSGSGKTTLLKGRFATAQTGPSLPA